MKQKKCNLFVFILFAMISACETHNSLPRDTVTQPKLLETYVRVSDGTLLPLKTWLPLNEEPDHIIIGLHGFNDYSNAFDLPARIFSKKYNIAVFSYDQRGFGKNKIRGSWSGTKTYVDDARSMISAVKSSYPDIPIYLLGESMGGAVAIILMTEELAPEIRGTILVAPAIWGSNMMPWYQKLALSCGALFFPWMTVSGKGLKIRASDNNDVLRNLSLDPIVIKETKIGTLNGLVKLMDEALAKTTKLFGPSLILYGQKDEVIPKKPIFYMMQNLLNNDKKANRSAIYENGFHMLLRDLQSSIVIDDIVSWILNANNPLPSRADESNISLLQSN